MAVNASSKGALLIWQEGGEFIQTGHVATVTQVLSDRVRIASSISTL